MNYWWDGGTKINKNDNKVGNQFGGCFLKELMRILDRREEYIYVLSQIRENM